MRIRTIAPCAEFPNDNPELHEGAVWVCLEVTGSAQAIVRQDAPASLATPSIADDEDDEDDIEIVDDLPMDGVLDESPALAETEPAVDDPFATLVRVLEDVVRSAGAGESALALLRAMLGRERLPEDATDDVARLRGQAAAWQAILRGESEDFSVAGTSTLDEWSACVVARALGEPARAEKLRRELRRRGVAAFGVVVEAA